MPRKLPPYFVKADRDSPCRECDKAKSTCKYCEKCYDCCTCSPTFICPHCYGYRTPAVSVGSEMTRDNHECQCEYCAGNCGKIIMDRDEGNYLYKNDKIVTYQPYCDKCIKKAEKT